MEFLPFIFEIISGAILLMILLMKIGRRRQINGRPELHLPPGPSKLPLIGSLHHLVGPLPHHTLRDLANKYGGLMHLQLGEVSAVVISSAEFAREVMVINQANFASRPSILTAEIVSYNCTGIAFAPYGEYWRQLRKLCSLELLSAKRVKSFWPIRQKELTRLMEMIDSKEGSTINISKEVDSLIHTITSKAAFGQKCEDQEKLIDIVKKCSEISGGFNIGDMYPSAKWLHYVTGAKTKLTTLKLIVKETLRLHPPGPLLLPRECEQRCKIGGYDIPSKTKVIINGWAIGRDPKYWKDPENFYPERFVGDSVDYRGTNMEYIPFGAGRRICPGITYGISMVETVLAQLLYHFNWKLPEDRKNEVLDMTETFGLVLRRKHDLELIPIVHHRQ